MENTEKTSKPVALITGASAGIGKTFASHLAQQGCDLILVARRGDKLQAIADDLSSRHGCGVEMIAADLSKQEDIARVAQRIRDIGGLEYLVNNAGFGTLGNYWEADLEGQLTMARLHVLAIAELTHAALGDMVARDRGNIINTASVAGFFQSRSNVMYCSTKKWVISFTEGLSFELTGSNVKVMAVCPGYTYSEFHDVMKVDREAIGKSWWMSAERIVSDSLKALGRGKVVCVPGLWRYKILCGISPLLPRGLVRRISDNRRKKAEKMGKVTQM